MAFSVYPEEPRNYTCETSEPAIFNVTEIDTTNSYDITGQYFTCPITGIYMFSIAIRNNYGSPAQGAIHMERSSRAQVNCNDDSDDEIQISNQASNSVAIICDAGQRVWLRIWCNEDGRTSLTNGKLNMFTGFLIG